MDGVGEGQEEESREGDLVEERDGAGTAEGPEVLAAIGEQETGESGEEDGGGVEAEGVDGEVEAEGEGLKGEWEGVTMKASISLAM